MLNVRGLGVWRVIKRSILFVVVLCEHNLGGDYVE